MPISGAHRTVELGLTGEKVSRLALGCMGMGTLVRLSVSARSAGCSLELMNIGKQVRMLLGTAHLLSAFTVVGEHGIKLN